MTDYSFLAWLIPTAVMVYTGVAGMVTHWAREIRQASSYNKDITFEDGCTGAFWPIVLPAMAGVAMAKRLQRAAEARRLPAARVVAE